MRSLWGAAAIALAVTGVRPAEAADVRLFTTGAYRQVAAALIPQYEARTGNRVVIESGTAGAIIGKIEAGQPFDLVVLTSQAVGDLVTEGKLVSDTSTDLARVGVAVRVGAPHPDIATAAAFKHMLIKARSLAYIDPTAGGSSGIYVSGLIERLGLAKKLRHRTVLVEGGLVGDKVADGEAEIGLQQLSELTAAQGVEIVGPLPREIQNFTVYGAAVNQAAAEPAAARELLAVFSGPDAPAVLHAKGMEPPGA